MNRLSLSTLIALLSVACVGDVAGPDPDLTGAVDASTPDDVTPPSDAGEVDSSVEPRAPHGLWGYVDPQGGCDLYVRLEPDGTYVSGMACPNGLGDTDIFLESGTYVDVGYQVQVTQLASTCPCCPAQAYSFDYALDPYRLLLSEELPMEHFPDGSMYEGQARYGCFYDGFGFGEEPLTCHLTGQPGDCR